jgi:hypothetical protein
MAMTKVVCVYQSGGDFDPLHVRRLSDQVFRNSPSDTEFVCLTDRPSDVNALGVRTLNLENRWPEYWCKIEAFRLSGPILYLDLDVTITGDLLPLMQAAETCRFIGIRHYRLFGINSSVMAWNGDASIVYKRFARKPRVIIEQYKKSTIEAVGVPYGDQGFIWHMAPRGRVYWDEMCPGMIMSYKKDWVAASEDVKSDVRIVFFHGRPRPWDVPEIAVDTRKDGRHR